MNGRPSNEPIDCPLAGALAQRLREARDDITERWLERIDARLSIGPEQIFPTEDLLDHIPRLIDGIADYLENPAEEISADVPVIAKAMELGELRLSQGYAAHEILKEYEILGGVLFAFLIRTVESITDDCTRSELLACSQRLFRALSVVQQVTASQHQRIADDAMRDREERLRSFNRMVSHELKNRITALQGASSLLQEPWVAENEQQRNRFVAIIQHSADGMHALLQDLLALSQMEGTRRHRNVRLAEAVAEAARQLRGMAQDRGVEIRIAPDLPALEVDAAAVELCLVNYLSNGIKYSDPAKSERWVEVRGYREERAEEDPEVIIEVLDNGLGVPPEARERIFERFFRADSVSDLEGTGLGLSIVRETVQAVGGRAWAEFDDGRPESTTFKIALPVRRNADAEPSSSQATAPQP